MGPSGKGPLREFRALTSADQRHETERAKEGVKERNTGGGAQLCSGFEREWRKMRQGNLFFKEAQRLAQLALRNPFASLEKTSTTYHRGDSQFFVAPR